MCLSHGNWKLKIREENGPNTTRSRNAICHFTRTYFYFFMRISITSAANMECELHKECECPSSMSMSMTMSWSMSMSMSILIRTYVIWLAFLLHTLGQRASLKLTLFPALTWTFNLAGCQALYIFGFMITLIK